MIPTYQLKVKDDNAELYIYGEIASDGYKWNSTDISANDIVKQLESINANKIDVYINSYGGEVAEGLAIYNVLKRHKAKVTTYVDGFACSIASVIAMAGDTRKMYDNSLLMIHNAWTFAQGNAADLEKAAEDLKVINESVKKAYIDVINISEDELTTLLDAETWLTAEKAVEMGFATEVVAAKKTDKASASAQALIYKMLTKAEDEPPAEPPQEPDDEPKPETEVEKVLADIVARLEKIEAEIFPEEKEPDDEPKPAEKASNYMEKLLNTLTK